MRALAALSAILLVVSCAGEAPAPAAATPPSPVIVAGACPFEGCQYGEWVAVAATPMYSAVNGTLLPANIQAGERVQALSGEIHAVPRKATVTRVYRSDEDQGIHVGSVVYFVHPLGEGAARIWHEGRTKDGSLDLALQFEGETPTTRNRSWVWWVNVRRADGTMGWLKNPEGFRGMDRLG